MYQFQIRASTQTGESIGLVGSIPELGLWDVKNCVRLRTSGDRYPLWWADVELPHSPESAPPQKIEYKYVRFQVDGSVKWEALGPNRWVTVEPHQPSTLIVDDGGFGYLQPYPYGYFENPAHNPAPPQGQGLKVVVMGSSVGWGCNAWLLKGWAWQLGQTLQEKYGHQLVNVSEIGANVSRTIERFPLVIPPQNPDVVIIALSLGNEGFAHCPPCERRAVQRRFESGLQQLIKMIRELGARPMLGGVYPNGNYSPDHARLLWETHDRMANWGVPILDWLAILEDGQGRWKPGISFDPAHPNTRGHRLMAEAIDLQLFDLDPAELAKEKQQLPQHEPEIPVYHDDGGFHLFASAHEKHLRVINTSKYPYTIAPTWKDVQTALQSKAGLTPGIYVARDAQVGALPCFSVGATGTIETPVSIPPNTDLIYRPAFHLFSPQNSQILFYDGHLGILKETDQSVRVINESDHEYNVHPMWKEVRRALKAMPSGVYDDPVHPETNFRTMMIGNEGLESRVKIPARSSVLFQYRCPLSEIQRIAIVPLGDRCAVRMLLYKLEYDGPAFPFDLTRTTNLADVADIIDNRFYDMWNPRFLHYNASEKRIYHGKWSGLSFAHETEDTDDPVQDMSPVHERMRIRYTARSGRFWYTLDHSDKLLFVRTGGTDRGTVINLMNKLAIHCKGKPFRLLIVSLQPSEEFAGLPDVLHYDLEFNPDRMYEDQGHWMYCTEIMAGILDSLGVSSKNLFWCPPNPPKQASHE